MCETCMYYRTWYASHVNQSPNNNEEDNIDYINTINCNQGVQGNNIDSSSSSTAINKSSSLLHNNDTITE